MVQRFMEIWPHVKSTSQKIFIRIMTSIDKKPNKEANKPPLGVLHILDGICLYC